MLCFVAAKVLLTGILEISTAAPLGVIAGIVLVAIAASWVFPKPVPAGGSALAHPARW